MTLRRPILTVFFSSVFFVGTLGAGLASSENLTASLFAGFIGEKDLTPAVGLELESVLEPGKEGAWSFCDYEIPELPQYNVALESVTVQEGILQGSVFMVDMLFKNTGNTRLFSDASDCDGMPVLNVGTQKAQDRDSIFGSEESRISGWISGNRIQMSDAYADPEQTFHVTFQSIALETDDIFREFFQPVVEGIAWVDAPFGIDIAVGNPSEQALADIQFVTDLSLQASALTDLERNLVIDLSEQRMYARFGETSVWSMQISSGAWDTPTPVGNYEILTKQELRIGQAWPHYRMPYFQLWDWRGYGIHALPYLANDGGTFWSEALNHIGIPVSHGCIRTLPEDAVTVYAFTEIGTPLTVQR